jgi:hypothetical protein
MEDQQLYWDRVAAQKAFTHPLDQGWLDINTILTAVLMSFTQQIRLNQSVNNT